MSPTKKKYDANKQYQATTGQAQSDREKLQAKGGK